MEGDRVILLWLDSNNEIVEQSPKLYVGDNTIEDLIEQYDEMLAERMEGESED